MPAPVTETPGHGPVDALWQATVSAPTSVLVPADGCVDLIVRELPHGAVEALVHPPTIAAHRAQLEPGRWLGVRFKVGAGGPVWAQGARLAAEARALCGARGVDPVALEALAAGFAADLGPAPALVRDFVAAAAQTGGALRLTGAWAVTHRQRTLEREAQRWLGTTPKRYLRIARARAAAQALRRGEAPAEVAFAHGFADQAHLTREARALLGLTPRQLGR